MNLKKICIIICLFLFFFPTNVNGDDNNEKIVEINDLKKYADIYFETYKKLIIDNFLVIKEIPELILFYSGQVWTLELYVSRNHGAAIVYNLTCEYIEWDAMECTVFEPYSQYINIINTTTNEHIETIIVETETEVDSDYYLPPVRFEGIGEPMLVSSEHFIWMINMPYAIIIEKDGVIVLDNNNTIVNSGLKGELIVEGIIIQKNRMILKGSNLCSDWSTDVARYDATYQFLFDIKYNVDNNTYNALYNKYMPNLLLNLIENKIDDRYYIEYEEEFFDDFNILSESGIEESMKLRIWDKYIQVKNYKEPTFIEKIVNNIWLKNILLIILTATFTTIIQKRLTEKNTKNVSKEKNKFI